jgi:methylphosphotriester-DNA--protein-cysteine methyltransferase
LTDLTPKEYVRKKRIQYSMELLATRKYSAKDAAHMAGFNNIGSFRDAFKKEYGKNPSDFLKEING